MISLANTALPPADSDTSSAYDAPVAFWPKDHALAAAVERALRATSYLSLRRIGVFALQGRVVLRGQVPSYYMKQLAQTTAMGTPDVEGLRNDLEVVSSR